MAEEARNISNREKININKPGILRKREARGGFNYQNISVKPKHLIPTV